MQLTKEITSKLKLYFKARFNLRDVPKGWIRGNCPTCGKQNSFGIHVELNKSNCFSCGYKKKPIQIIREFDDVRSDAEVMTMLNSSYGIDLGLFAEKEEHEYTGLKLPESYLPITIGNSKVANIARKMLRERGFNIRTLSMMGVGYCTKGPYKFRIIFPYYCKGELVYFQARDIFDIGPKFTNPMSEEVGVGKQTIIYNEDALDIYKKVWLFESPTNCLTIGLRATGYLGKNLSPYQISRVIDSKAEKIVIGLDDDAYAIALKLGIKLSRYKKVKVLKFPKDLDANALGKKKTILLEKNTPYKTTFELQKELVEYEANTVDKYTGDRPRDNIIRALKSFG